MVHADLQMCQRKFRPVKYTRHYSYANFGTFILGHPVYIEVPGSCWVDSVGDFTFWLDL